MYRVTETGWAVTGPSQGAAVASQSNAQSYWSSVACDMFNDGHVFWYAYQDYTASPSFGLFDSNNNQIWNTVSFSPNRHVIRKTNN